jgi:hypothetical protein
MSDAPGTIPTAKDRSRQSGPGNILHPFDQSDYVLEKRGAPPRYSAVMWPFLIGLVLAVIAPKLLEVLTAVNPWAERLVFPFVLLAGRPEFGLTWVFDGKVPLLVLLLQFPAEGLLTMFSLRRRMSTGVAIGQLIVIHLVAAFVLLLIVHPHLR